MKRHMHRVSLFALLLAGALCYSGCDFDKKEFIDTARSTYESFYNNNTRITDSTIDWNSIRINGDDVGRLYMQMTTDYDRMAFRRAQIVRLRTICSMKGWNVQNVKNWRIKDRGVESASVIGDAPGGTILLSLRKFQAEKKVGQIEVR
ncbi:MAG TPA: hypothetical protein VI215_09580 [Bacteroidota bacterium]|jgi:hypothetical protein